MNAVLMQLYRWNWIPYVILAATLIWLLYDTFVPVVVTQENVVSRTENSAVIHITGYKLRECKYLGIQAYSVGPRGIRHDATIRRIDVAARDLTRPIGYYNFGYWDVRPTAGAIGVLVYAQHSCSDTDLRATKMAEVVL